MASPVAVVAMQSIHHRFKTSSKVAYVTNLSSWREEVSWQSASTDQVPADCTCLVLWLAVPRQSRLEVQR
jgi:hypothetical protein